MDEKLEKFEEKYIDKDNTYYYKTAYNIIKDINYLEEHSKRNTINERFDFSCIPTKNNRIIGGFLELFFSKNRSYYFKEEKLMEFLKIIDITRNILNKYLEEESNVEDLREWEDLFEFYTNGMIFKEMLSSFVGTNYSCKKIIKGMEGEEE